MEEQCFVHGCEEPVKIGKTSKNGRNISSCEEHEDIWVQEFACELIGVAE